MWGAMKVRCDICNVMKDSTAYSDISLRNRKYICVDCAVPKNSKKKHNDFSKISKKKVYRDPDEGDDLVIIKKRRKCLRCQKNFTTTTNNYRCPACHEETKDIKEG